MFGRVVLDEAGASVNNDADPGKTVEDAAPESVLPESAMRPELSPFLQTTSPVFMRLLGSPANWTERPASENQIEIPSVIMQLLMHVGQTSLL